MTTEQVNSYFQKVGLPKPTIDELFAGLEAAGFRFLIEGEGLFIGFPSAGTPEAQGMAEALRRFPLAMFEADEMVEFIRRRAVAGGEVKSTLR